MRRPAVYSAALRSTSGTLVWESGDVRAVVEEADLVLRLAVPALMEWSGSRDERDRSKNP